MEGDEGQPGYLSNAESVEGAECIVESSKRARSPLAKDGRNCNNISGAPQSLRLLQFVKIDNNHTVHENNRQDGDHCCDVALPAS